MMRISNTKASRTAAEREEYYRINALLDQALDLTFPCSDPVAITINGIRRKGATDSGGKLEPVTRSQEFSVTGFEENTLVLSGSPGNRGGGHFRGRSGAGLRG